MSETTIWQKRIKALTDKGISQVDIARKAHCSASLISLLADGQRNCPNYSIGSKIVALCDFVSITIDDEN